MIQPEQVYLAIEPVDMRWGIERLSCHVQHAIGRTPCDGQRLRLYQSATLPHQAVDLGCHRRLALPAPPA